MNFAARRILVVVGTLAIWFGQSAAGLNAGATARMYWQVGTATGSLTETQWTQPRNPSSRLEV